MSMIESINHNFKIVNLLGELGFLGKEIGKLLNSSRWKREGARDLKRKEGSLKEAHTTKKNQTMSPIG